MPALLLTKWVHTLEIEWEDHPPGLEEVDIIVRLKNLLAEMEVEHDGQHSLAATLSKAWSTFLDDVSLTPSQKFEFVRVTSNFSILGLGLGNH